MSREEEAEMLLKQMRREYLRRLRRGTMQPGVLTVRQGRFARDLEARYFCKAEIKS